MAIPKFLEDLLIISKLGDNPGSDNGLSSSGLRAKFDEAGVKIQQYINNTLIPALSELADPTAGLKMKADINMDGHRVTGLGEPAADGDAVPLEYARKIGNPHNLLDNSDFRNLVNQRGQTSYNYGYCIDRWFFYNEDIQNSRIEIRDGYIHIEATTIHNLAQRLPLTVDTEKTYTLAYKMLDGTIVINYAQPKKADGYCYVAPYYNNEGGGSADIVWCAMYEGEYTAETLPEYQPKEYGSELLACQTQLQRFRTESERKTYCEDFRPAMRMTPNGMVSKFEQEIDGVTYYFASTEL